MPCSATTVRNNRADEFVDDVGDGYWQELMGRLTGNKNPEGHVIERIAQCHAWTEHADRSDAGGLDEPFTRAVGQSINRFTLPRCAGDARLVPLRAPQQGSSCSADYLPGLDVVPRSPAQILPLRCCIRVRC